MDSCTEVEPGEDFVVECHTYGKGVYWKEGDDEPGDHSGKLCLPVAVKGIEAGDTIAIEIKKILTLGMGLAGNTGPLQRDEDFRGEVMDFLIPIEGEHAALPGGIEAKITPALGHINVEPEVIGENPGRYGGNMDLAEACEGNTIYLRAEKDGAKIVLGDPKAHVAEGEASGEGIQCGLDVTLNVTKSDRIQVRRPFVETPTHWIAIGIDPDYWTAVKQATADLVEFAQTRTGLEYNPVYFWVTHFAHARNGAIWLMGESGQDFHIPRTVTLHLPKTAKIPNGQVS
jgi:acetamidase/formamidase